MLPNQPKLIAPHPHSREYDSAVAHIGRLNHVVTEIRSTRALVPSEIQEFASTVFCEQRS